MAANEDTDVPSPERTYRLQSWGFLWVVLGFLVLLQELFGLNSLGMALAVILVGIAIPRGIRRASRIWSALEYLGYLAGFIIVFYGLTRFSKVLNFNTGLALSVASLSIGIALQSWAEILRRSQSPDMATNPLIDKIRRL